MNTCTSPNPSMVRTCLTICLSCLFVLSAVAESNWSVQSQYRRIWSTVGTSVPGDSDSDTQELEAVDDFGLFDHTLTLRKTLQTLDGENFADARANATLDVLIAIDSLSFTGGIGVTTETTGSATLSEADALADTSVTFAVTSPTRLRLTGLAEVSGFGQVEIQLIDSTDQSLLFTLFIQESSSFLEINEQIDVESGSYRLSAFCFGDAESRNSAGLDGQSASFSLTLNIEECYSQEHLYAVAADSSELWVNDNPLGDGTWSSLGNLPAGATGATDIAIDPNSGNATAVATIGGEQRLLTFDVPTGTVEYNEAINFIDIQSTGLFGLDFTTTGQLKVCYRIFFGGGIGSTLPYSGNVFAHDTLAIFVDLFTTDTAFAVSHDTDGIAYVTGGNELIGLNWMTQSTISNTQMSGGATMTALEISPTDGMMVGCRTTQELVRIEPSTGAVFTLGSTPMQFDGFAFSWPSIEICGPVSELRCDLTGDGLLDGADLDELEGCAQGPAGGIATGACVGSDVNRDGAVDVLDYAELSRCLGQ